MAKGETGKNYLLAMANAMNGVGRLNDLVVGLAHEGATGSLSVLLDEFGQAAFAGNAESARCNSYAPGYMVDAYDAAVAAKRPDVTEWLAANKVPVVAAARRTSYNKPPFAELHYNAVFRAFQEKDDRSLVAMVRNGVVDLNASLLQELLVVQGSDGVKVARYCGANERAIVKVSEARLLDLCVAHALPQATRAILDSGYAATPSFFKVAFGLNDFDLIGESVGKAADVKTLASRMLAAAASSDNLPGMRLALAHGANPNALIDNFESSKQSRPLFFCTSAAAVHLLCDAGANVEIRNEDEMSPALFFAGRGESKDVELLTALAHRGADFTRRAAGRTIGQLASLRSNSIKEVIRAAKTGSLVSNAAQVPIADVGGEPAVQRAPGMSCL
jgi:hypothetical protein